MASWLKVAGFVAFPFIGSVPGSMITRKAMDWYDTIVKPSWRPPKKAFGPVWTTLYASMGYASYLVWNASGGFGSRAMVLYGGSILLNWAWTPLFFGYHKLGAALVDLLALWGVVGLTGLEFYKIVPKAGYLMAPYFAWVTLAAALNYNIWKNNPTPKEE